jgi:dipeptidyl-peptidase-4
MKKLTFIFFLILSVSNFTFAQKKAITLEEIWGGAFRTEGLDEIRSLKNGTQYTVLNFDRGTKTSRVDLYDYASLAQVGTIVNSAKLENIPYFTSYEFTADETKILLATEVESIFRRSSLGIYYIFDVKSGKTIKISENKIQEPKLSPDNSKVAYVFENNIYIFDILKNSSIKVTKDGVKNEIINGVTDWVYEEEFAFVRAFDWNADGTKIAFLRFDETKVPEFSMDVYGSALYQTQQVFKYPKAGENNAIVTLHMLDVKASVISNIALPSSYYIPRIKWMNNANMLSVQTLNRHQDNLTLYAVNAKNNKVSVLLEEKDAAYVDVTDNLTFLADDSFIWTSEKDGFNHIYVYNEDGKLMNQITKGSWEVTNYYGYDQDEDRVYYQSTEDGSINKSVYSINSNGKDKRRLTTKNGQNRADFSADFTYFINNFSNVNTPSEYSLHEALTGKLIKEILNNKTLLSKLEGYEISQKEFSSLSINGNELNMWMIKPADFDASKKYPLFMFQYSGPGSQSVSNSWMGSNDYWYQLLASEGYIVVCVDGRGTGFKGRDFKKVTQKELGKYEVEDQIAAAKKLSELPFIDAERTGIWGWSYGGFMSTNCILKGNDTFEMAIAVAPVTSWAFYDSIYTERYMQTPQENPSGYDDNSPFNYPELLKGKYLLVHGTGDDNVHVQNTMRMIEALVQANKPFDWAIYPDKNHGIYGGNTRLHLYTKMTNFIKENL